MKTMTLYEYDVETYHSCGFQRSLLYQPVLCNHGNNGMKTMDVESYHSCGFQRSLLYQPVPCNHGNNGIKTMDVETHTVPVAFKDPHSAGLDRVTMVIMV